jgi:sugar (pentulose or hexulose) kinase
MEECVLVVELTTRAVHSRLISESGRVAYSSTRLLETRLPYPDRPYIVELDPDKLWFSVCSTAADCAKHAEPGVSAITTTGQRFTTAVIGRGGRTLALCPNMDARGVEVGDFFSGSIGEDAYRITGLYPPFLFSGSRIRWFVENDPGVFNAAEFFTTINGWLYFMLTGKPAEEPSQASGTFLFDVRGRRWSEEMCRAAGVGLEKLPEVTGFGQLAGYPTEKFSKATGIPLGTPVVMGAGDTQCAGIGSTALSEGQAYVSLGSTCPLQIVMAEPRVDEEKRMWTGCFPLDGLWVLESNAGVCGIVLDWLASSVLMLTREEGVDYERFDELAGKAPRGSRSVLAFLGPSTMDAKRLTEVLPAAIILPSLMVGEKPGAGDIARACYENIVFACRDNLDQMKQVYPRVGTPVFASGGLSKSSILIQMLADVLATPVSTPLERRASAIGASVACWSFLKSESPRSIVERMVELRTVNPSPGSEDYQADYRRWRLIYERLRSLT